MKKNDLMQNALKLPSGARFYRCALQVNPFEYLRRHNKASPFADEDSYNTAIVKACHENNIEVIAITDHYRVRSSESLREAATKAGIYVFPGFEAVTKDGVHLLCLFDSNRDVTSLERVLGDCGIHDDEIASPTGKYDVIEFLKESWDNWGAVCIAAHVASSGGLLNTLPGRTAINAWKWPHLLACALPGPVSHAPYGIRQIIENKIAEYRRNRPIAVVNAQDISSPEDLSKPGASCWIKMSEVSVEGL
ncbi:MAG: phosphoesterase, partial [Deltaproteobacteria bacterium]|nr:phosphoesterase [Deltaproteobacteria bacterium]